MQYRMQGNHVRTPGARETAQSRAEQSKALQHTNRTITRTEDHKRQNKSKSDMYNSHSPIELTNNEGKRA